ncbi:GntR family transcriptional regulator [Flavobacterium fluviatile]|uniref:GntR family transcriptional regulator n=1 Tax=Flavobacterium fluviatile TaxID=1862387 RepID=UPI0013D5BF09|nr:GntR family transcriptional regulator [Flavobacterium fluviatile]
MKELSININKVASIPLYQQIVEEIINEIVCGKLKMYDKMLSINEFSKNYAVSRDTVEKAYKELKKRNVIIAQKGVGFYINSTKLVKKKKIIFFINKLSSYKLKIYYSFLEVIGEQYHTDFEVYHCDETLFLNLMEKHFNNYDYYVIMPHFKTQNGDTTNYFKNSISIIKSIPLDKLVVMDNDELNIDGNVIEIYQDFENDLYNALNAATDKIKKYKNFFLVAPTQSIAYLNKISQGFQKFCSENFFQFGILDQISDTTIINIDSLYIIVEDDSLVKILDLISAKNYLLGQDIGVLSYNETPLKRLLNIAVVSTNFVNMGETAAKMIIKNEKGRIKNPFQFIDRSSI